MIMRRAAERSHDLDTQNKKGRERERNVEVAEQKAKERSNIQGVSVKLATKSSRLCENGSNGIDRHLPVELSC